MTNKPSLTEEQIERLRIEAVFHLEGELHERHPEFLDEWDGVVAWWYDGVPEYAESDFRDDDREFRTAVVCEVYGQMTAPEGWERVESHSSSGETECPACGPGTDWDDSDEQALAQRRGAVTNTGYRGDPACPLCEGSGYIYLGDGTREIIFARIVLSEEEAEAAEEAASARKTTNGTPFDLVPVHLPNASTLGYGLGWARPGNWIEFRESEHDTATGVVLGRLNRGPAAGSLVVLAFDMVDHRYGFERWVKPEDVSACRNGPLAEYLHLLALLASPEFVRKHGARIMKDAKAGYVSESSVDPQWSKGSDDERRSFYKQPVPAREPEEE